jgi:HEAT repeat protein
MKNMQENTKPYLWRTRSGEKTIPRQARDGEQGRTIVFTSIPWVFVCLMIFAIGCEQPVPAQPERPGEPLRVDLSPKRPAEDVNNPRLEALRIIQAALADGDPLVRVNAIEVIAATRQVKLMPKVVRLLNDQFVPVRFAAALAIGDLRYSLAENSLRGLLKDKNENVRIAAAYALTKLGFAEYSQLFRSAIASNDQTVRANAALLLGKSGGKDALKFLYWAMQHKDSDDRVAFQAAESIARLGDARIYQKLWTMLISAYADVRVTGIRAMGALGTAEAKNALITMLDDDLLEVRLASAEQLGMLKDPAGEREVLQVFEKNLTTGLDEKSRERTYVLTALAIGQIGTPHLAKFLPPLLKNESKFVRIAAAKAVLQSTVKR